MKQHNLALLEKPAKMKKKTLRDIYVDTSDGGQGFNHDAIHHGIVPLAKDTKCPYFIISDGTGSSKLSHLAALIAITKIRDHVREEAQKIEDRGTDITEEELMKMTEIGIKRANGSIIYANSVGRSKAQKLKPKEKDGRTTVDFGIIFKNKLHVSHVGDGRIYVVTKNGKIEQITDDDTNAYKLFKDNKMNADEVKVHPDNKYVNNLLGINEKISIQTGKYSLDEIKVIFAATDGLYSLLTEDQIAYCLNQPGSAEEKYKKIITIADNPSEMEKIAEKNERYSLSSDNRTGLIAIIE